MSIAILIPNYNGRHLLEKCLKSVVQASQLAPVDCKVVIVDNCSTDDGVALITRDFPTVEVVAAEANDFLFSLNPVAAQRHEELLIILNNDMWVAPDFIAPLLRHFDDDDVFAATCGIRDWDGEGFSMESRPNISTVQADGSWYKETYEPPPETAAPVQLASGGASACRRDRFVELGGFDPLYRPGYSEDVDLSLRAHNRGWKVIYEPTSIVHHLGSVSMKRRFGRRIERIALRNRVLLVAKLLGSKDEHRQFLVRYLKRAVQNSLWGNRSVGSAMWMALPRLPKALAGRSRLLPQGTVNRRTTNGAVHPTSE